MKAPLIQGHVWLQLLAGINFDLGSDLLNIIIILRSYSAEKISFKAFIFINSSDFRSIFSFGKRSGTSAEHLDWW